MNVSVELQTAVDAAHAAGHVLQRYLEDGVVMRDKSAAGGKTYDLVSDADIESEQVIAEMILQRHPSHAILGEEAYQDTGTDSEHLWIIDPLDGTNNYAHGIPHFAVSVAYYRAGRPLAGAVYNPARDDLYVAGYDQGATLNGQSVQVSGIQRMAQSMIGCGFYYDRGAMMRSTLAAVEQCFAADIHGIRRFGTASLDLCMVGCGQLDGFFEYKLSPWDFAAGALFVAEAGGRITTTDGLDLPLVATPVLATNGHIHDELMAITSKHQFNGN
ncbi:MAG: inositol monophosphatase family protein [Planctomycetota bacterium]